MVFYLKVNRTEGWALRCLQHWIDSIMATPGEHKTYILSDNEKSNELILEKIDRRGLCLEFLTSRRESPELIHIVQNVTDKYWANAGFAHLTTFLHAWEQGYDTFWNIDADDTLVCLPSERTGEMLKIAGDYAQEHDVNLFSLDMWCTRTGGGKYWSYGVTHTVDPGRCLSVMTRCCEDEAYYKTRSGEINVDLYTAYLRQYTTFLKIETFYFENLKFIHYSQDFFLALWGSGFYHWKNGTLHLPFLYDCVGISSCGQLLITNVPVKLDMQIEDDESLCFFIESSPQLHSMLFLDLLIPRNSRIMIYGAGESGTRLAKNILATNHCELVCMSAQNWQEKKIDGVTVCSIDTALASYEFDYIVIGILNRAMNEDVWNMLISKGVDEEKIISKFAGELKALR